VEKQQGGSASLYLAELRTGRFSGFECLDAVRGEGGHRFTGTVLTVLVSGAKK
jgi:hypothetical protein